MEQKARVPDIMQLVSFVLDKETFAVDVMKVQGVERVREITALPGMPDFVEGVINLRESIIPIVDLRKRFALPQKEYGKETRIVLVELKTGIVVGMIVDQVNEVFQLSFDAMRSVPQLGSLKTKISRNYIKGVAKKDNSLVIVLNAEKIFSEQEEEAMKNV